MMGEHLSIESDIQKIMWQLEMPLISVSVPSDMAQRFLGGFGEPVMSEALANRAQIRRISSPSDVLAVLVHRMKERLGEVMERPDPEHMTAFNTLAFLLSESAFSNQSNLSLRTGLVDWIEKHRTQLLDEGIEDRVCANVIGALRMRNLREAIDEMAHAVAGISGIEFTDAMGIKPSSRYPEVTPALVSEFQRSDRPLQFWLDIDSDGPLLFIVYYSGRCTFLQCFGCALPSLSANNVIAPHHLFEQTDHVIDGLLTVQEKKSIRSVFLSNNGSMFDDPTFSPIALHHAIVRSIAEFPKLKKIVLETRAEFLDEDKLRRLTAIGKELKSPVRLEIALGVEVFDERLRNKVARKGLSNAGIERLVKLLGQFDLDLRCYFMLKPHPSVSDGEAYEDISRGLDFLDDLSTKTGTQITMHLNPTYVAIGTALESAFHDGQYTPPRLEELASFVKRNANRPTRIHLGLNDEGLAVEGGSFLRPGSDVALSELRRHNMTNSI